jgi:DNA-binding CsgD family transcriptional regulator
VSEGTVRKHLENIYARLDVHSRTEALARAADLLVG